MPTCCQLLWQLCLSQLTWAPGLQEKYYSFFLSWPGCMTGRILLLGPGIKPVPPAVETQGPNHWTARKVPWGGILYPRSPERLRNLPEIKVLTGGDSLPVVTQYDGYFSCSLRHVLQFWWRLHTPVSIFCPHFFVTSSPLQQYLLLVKYVQKYAENVMSGKNFKWTWVCWWVLSFSWEVQSRGRSTLRPSQCSRGLETSGQACCHSPGTSDVGGTRHVEEAGVSDLARDPVLPMRTADRPGLWVAFVCLWILDKDAKGSVGCTYDGG